MEQLQELIHTYGYIVVFIGTFLEGETILVLAGFAAHQGYFDFPMLVFIAFVGSFLGDQFFFWFGRHYADRVFNRFPTLHRPAKQARQLLDRYNTPFILANRFMYGLRIAGPIVVGTTSITWMKFFWLNMSSAAIWALTISSLGYLFGETVELIVDDIQRVEKFVVIIIIAGGILAWWFHRWRERQRQANSGEA